MAPLFSIVLPVANRADTVGRAIVAVLGQTFEDLEVVVVDAGSTDRTLAAVHMVADRRVRVLHGPVEPAAEPDAGPAVGAALSRGLASARGTWTAVIDADTVVRPQWLARMARLARYEDADTVACGGVQHHRDHSLSEVGAARETSRPGAVLRRAGAIPGGRFVCTPEELVDWFEPTRASSGSSDEQCLAWATEAIAVLGTSPTPSPDLLARYSTIGGLAAARLHRHPEARRLLAMARQLNNGELRYWARWLVASVPPLSEVVWPARTGFAT